MVLWRYKQIFISRIINSFGSWCTFLAISMLINEKFGPEYVVLNFIVQSVPSLLLAGRLSKYISQSKLFTIYVVGNILCALSVLVLYANTSLNVLFAFSIFNATVATFTTPAFSSLVGAWIKKDDIKLAHKSLGALNACILALAPPAGAWIAGQIGMKSLFLIDAASFILAVICLSGLPKIQSHDPDNQAELKTGSKTKPLSLYAYPALRRALWTMTFFLAVGAAFNGVEFAIFKHFTFSSQAVGNALGAWGVGNLIALALGSRLKNISIAFFAFIFSLAFVVIAITPLPHLSALLFLVAGFCSAELTGAIRGGIQLAIPPGVSSFRIWSKVQLDTGIINILFYGLCLLLIKQAPYMSIVILLSVCGAAFLLCLFWLERRSQA